MKPPCKDCQNRVIGCHSGCERYQEYRTWADQKMAERAQEAISKEAFSRSYYRVQKKKNRKR